MWEPSPSLLSSSSSSSPSLNASLKILLLLTSHIFAGISELQITHKCVCVHLPRLCPPTPLTCTGDLQGSPQEEGEQEQRLPWGHGAGAQRRSLRAVPQPGETGWAPRVEVTYLTSLGSGPAHQRFLPSFPGPVEFEELEMIL